MVEVVAYLVGVQGGRQAVEVQGQFGQVVAVVFQGAFTAARQGDFLVELLIKFAETCYISAGSVNGVCFFFMGLCI